jgi:DNA-binding Lrp family transcriptional regulator
MDELDRAILAQVAADARVSVATLTRRLKIARSTVQARLERLETSGVIAGYTVKLGPAARQDQLRATVLMTTEPRAQAAVLARLKAASLVERVHTTSGKYNLMVQIAAQSTAALDEVLDTITNAPGVLAADSLVHLSTKLDRAT